MGVPAGYIDKGGLLELLVIAEPCATCKHSEIPWSMQATPRDACSPLPSSSAKTRPHQSAQGVFSDSKDIVVYILCTEDVEEVIF